MKNKNAPSEIMPSKCLPWIFRISIQIPKYVITNITLSFERKSCDLNVCLNPEQLMYIQGKLMYKALYEGVSQRNILSVSLTKQARILMIIMKRALETPYHSRILMIIMKQ